MAQKTDAQEDGPQKPSQYALLGLLSRGSHSGYDLKKQIESSIGHFWRESYGQIYPNLKLLERTGHVTSELERQEGRPDKKVYTITNAGRAALERWLEGSPKPTPPRNELLLKLFFAHHSPERAAEHVRGYKQRFEEDSETYKGIERWLETEHAGHPALPYWLMTLSYGRLEAEALLKWCDETLVTLGALSNTLNAKEKREE